MTAKNKVYIGIDVGSRTTKAIALGKNGIIAKAVQPTNWDTAGCSKSVLDELMQAAEISDPAACIVYSTGYGRDSVAVSKRRITEITCHARGAAYINRSTRTVIDIGGQDAKAISVSADGFATDFVMNDRCAAGTGRFLEFMADSIGLPLQEFAELGLKSRVNVEISSMCTVFAESEMLSLKARGTAREDVIAGLHYAIAKRLAVMAAKIGCRSPVLLTGGVALNGTLRKALADTIEMEIEVPEDPVIIGALGAALLAKEYSRI